MADSVEPKPVKQGNVKILRNQFSVKEDETLAYKLQNEEFSTHYLHNRVQRQNVRSNIPVAKDIQKVEMDELMRQQQLLNQLEREDAVVAEEIQRKFLEESNNLKRLQLTDEELAKKLQKNVKFSDDVVQDLANDFNNIDIYNENNPEYIAKLQEEQDLEIAKYLQEQENRKSAIRTQQSRNHIQKNRTNPESAIYSDEDLARALQEEEDLKYNSTNNTRNNNNTKIYLPKSHSSFVVNIESDFYKQYEAYNINRVELKPDTPSIPSTHQPIPISTVNFRTPKTNAKTNLESRKSMYEIECVKNDENRIARSTTFIQPSTESNLPSGKPDMRKQKLVKTNTCNSQFDLNALNMTDNIIAAIDPTFKRRYSLKHLNLVKNSKEKDPTFYKNNTLNKKIETILIESENLMDTQIIQGQKRTSLKSIKKSPSVVNCAQQ